MPSRLYHGEHKIWTTKIGTITTVMLHFKHKIPLIPCDNGRTHGITNVDGRT
jgi:hypothetical protein